MAAPDWPVAYQLILMGGQKITADEALKIFRLG